MGVTNVIGNVLKNHKMTGFNVGLSAYFGVDEYQTERQNGASRLSAFGSAAVDTILPLTMGLPMYFGFEAIMHGPEMAMAGRNQYDQYKRGLGRQQRLQAFSNSQFNDTEQAYTMRQASQAIAERSRYNMQQARLGREAQFMMK